MKRFIRYLYEYENEKRIRNVGFIKVETGCEDTIVHIQAKGFHSWEERRLVLYLFYAENDGIIVVPQGELSLTSPVLSWHHNFAAEDVGGEEIYSKICGILIETGSGRRVAATWDDKSVDVSRVKEAAAAEPIGHGEEKDERTAPEEEDLRPVQEEPGRKCIKISRKDISKLPRCEWKLANNQFLIYGYNNFHHLLLIDNGNSLKLGVPGIYHIKEAECARTFGFKEFIQARELEINNDLQDNQEEMFGYWCRPIRGRNDWKQTIEGDRYNGDNR